MFKVVFGMTISIAVVACSAPETMSPSPTLVTYHADALPTAASLQIPCNLPATSADSGVEEFWGIYERQFERSAFTIDNASCTVWLTGNLAAACDLVDGCQKGSRFSMRLKVRGTISQPGRYGHGGMYVQELHVEQVTSATLLSR